MGYLIGRRYKVGGAKQKSLFDEKPKPRAFVAELTLSNGRGRFLIRDDGAKQSVVDPNDPWSEPIVQGVDVFEAADKIDMTLQQ